MSVHRFPPHDDGLAALDERLHRTAIDRERFYRSLSEVRRRVRLRSWLSRWALPIVLCIIALLSMAAFVMTILISHEGRVGALLGLGLGVFVVGTLKAFEKL